MPASHLDIATRHAVMLERLKVAEARQFNQLVAELRAQINQVYTLLEGRTLSELNRAQLNGLLASLQGAQRAALSAKQSQLMARLERISEYETEFEKSSLEQVVAGRVPIAAASYHAAWALANAMPLSATGDLLAAWVTEMTAEEVAKINKVILRGFAEGWTNDDLRQILNGTKAMTYADGLLPKMAKHNATIIRTAIQHVASTSRESVWQANSDLIDKYRWVSTLDSRTSPQCRSLDGQEFPIGKGPRPPIHPNCRSTTIGVLKGKLRVLQEDMDRASADGQVDGNLTYYEWLKRQDADFQRDVLGPARYAMFTDEGMTADKFARLQLGSAFEPLTLEEMKARGW